MESTEMLCIKDRLLQLDLSVDKLNQFKNVFNENNDWLSKEEFLHNFIEIFNSDESVVVEIFDEINKTKLAWIDFFDYLSSKLEPGDVEQCLELGVSQYVNPPHVKNDTIIKIVLLETDLYFSYAIISKYGCVGLYDGNLNFLTSYMVLMAREDLQRSDAQRRRKNRWITDAIFLENILMFVVVSTTRSMTIYDASGLKHIPLWLILGFPDIIQCLSYTCSKDKKKLYIGTDYGAVEVLKFQQPKDKLFRVKRSGKVTIFYYQELINEKDYVLIRKLGRFHTNSVCFMDHFRNERLLITGSRENMKSVIIKNIDEANESYIFKQHRGANCFAINDRLKLLITGSDDTFIRIWNYLVSSQPLAKLKAHKCGIIDIVIIEGLKVFLSCSRDAIVKLWDLNEYKCLQTVHLKFPFIENRVFEWGIKSIYKGPKRTTTNSNTWERDCILIACCNTYAKINFYYMDGQDRNLEALVLPPQPLQNSVLIPKTWHVDQDEIDKKASEEIITTHKNLDHLNFILNKDILRDDQKSDINYRISVLEASKLDMKWSVEQCAPYLALKLHEINEITLKPDLPTSSSKKIKSLIEKTRAILKDVSTKNIIFSEISTSSKSSRSSIIEFET